MVKPERTRFFRKQRYIVFANFDISCYLINIFHEYCNEIFKEGY